MVHSINLRRKWTDHLMITSHEPTGERCQDQIKMEEIRKRIEEVEFEKTLQRQLAEVWE